MGQKTLWDSLKRLAKDGWITIKPNGRRNKGQPVLLGENGEILGGMGGKFNGLKMKDVKDANKKLKQKNEYAKSGHSKGESPELYNAPIPSAAANAPAIPGDYKNSPDFKKLTPDAQTMVNQTAAHIKKLPLAKMAEHGPALYEELDKVIKELANNGSKFDSKVSEMVTNLSIAAMSAATATPTPPNQPKPSKSETSQFEGYDKLSSLNASEIDKHAKVINESKATPEDKAFMMDALRQATSYMAENGMDAAAAKVLSGINGVWVASSNPDALKKAKDALSGLLGEMNATVELVNAGGTYASKQEAAQPVQPTQPAQPAQPQAEIPHTQKADISQYQQFAGYNGLDKYTKNWFDEKANALMKADMSQSDKDMLTYGMQLALQNGVDPKKKAEKYGGKFLGKALGVMDAIGGIAQATKQGNQKMLDFYKNAAKQSIEALGGTAQGASNMPAATTTPSSVSPTPSAAGEILPSQKGNLKDYKKFMGYNSLNMTSKMVLDDAVQSLQKAMSDMNLDVADMAKITKGVQVALSKSVDGKLGPDVQHMLIAAKSAAKKLYGSEAYNEAITKAHKFAKIIDQLPTPTEAQQKEMAARAAKQAEYEKQQAFNKTHSFTQQTTDADRNKFKYATDKFLSDQAKADVAAIPNTLQNGKFAKTKHKNKFEQELGEGGDSFKKYSGMAYGLMKSSNKDLATKAQNIAVAVANGQMEGSKAISLLQSMDAMQKVKDYTDPKSEPPAYTSIHSGDIHNSGTFKASALPPDPKVAVIQYTGNAYASLNGQLRQNQKLSAKNKKLMDDINKAFALPEVKAKDNLTVYRGITSTQLQHLPIGGTFTNKGFVSTSSDAYEASKFAGSNGALMEIRVKKGQPALSVKDVSTFPDEKEVLLPAATQFTVVGKKIGPGGRPVLIVDYVPPANVAKDRAMTYLQRAGWASTPKDDAQRRQAIFDALRRM